MFQIVTLLVILAIEGFWMWMFSDMTKNDSIPNGAGGGFAWPPSTKWSWAWSFLFLNVFAAMLYYFHEYRPRQ